MDTIKRHNPAQQTTTHQVKHHYNIKKPLTCDGVPLSFLTHLLHGIYNLGHRNDIIKAGNDFIANYHNDKDNIIHFRFAIEQSQTIQENAYGLIMQQLYKNCFYRLRLSMDTGQESDKMGNVYFFYYLPLTSTELDKFVNQSIDKIFNNKTGSEREEQIEIFYQTYDFLENCLIQFISGLIGFNLLINIDGNQLTSAEIKSLKEEFSESMLEDSDIQKFLPQNLNHHEIDLSQYGHEERTLLFSLAFVTMNGYLLNVLLKINNHSYYEHLQSANPLIISDFIIQQSEFLKFYIWMNRKNMDTFIYHQSSNLTVKDLIIDFYDKVNHYPNFIKVIFYQLDKSEQMLSGKNNLSLKINPDVLKQFDIPTIREQFANLLASESLTV